MLDTFSRETKEIAELITLLNSTIEAINMKLLSLDQKNIIRLNYVPLITDASLGSATPKQGWIRSVMVSGKMETQAYDGSVWQTLARKDYVDTQDTATLNSANSYTDTAISGLATVAGITGPGGADSHTHSIPSLAVS